MTDSLQKPCLDPLKPNYYQPRMEHNESARDKLFLLSMELSCQPLVKDSLLTWLRLAQNFTVVRISFYLILLPSLFTFTGDRPVSYTEGIPGLFLFSSFIPFIRFPTITSYMFNFVMVSTSQRVCTSTGSRH